MEKPKNTLKSLPKYPKYFFKNLKFYSKPETIPKIKPKTLKIFVIEKTYLKYPNTPNIHKTF